MRQVLVVMSYVSRRTSCLCLARTVCMYTRQTVLSYEGWLPHFLFARHLTTLFSSLTKNKHSKLENRCESTLSRDSRLRTESLTRLRNAFAFRWHVLDILRQSKLKFFFNILNYACRRSIHF